MNQDEAAPRLSLAPAADAGRELPTRYAYGPVSRLLVAGGTLLASFPLASILAFLAGNPPAVADLGPLMLAVLFLVAPPIFLILRFGHYFRSFEVGERRLVVTTLGQHWEIYWYDVTRIIRRSRRRPWGQRSYRVHIKLDLADGSSDWIQLFDNALPGADDLYAQLLRHTPRVTPTEIVDGDG